MAKTLKQPGASRAIATLEEAVHLLRQAPAEIWICHWTGSAPYALALLFFWTTVTNPRTSAAATAAGSLAMAVLLVWMSCWRAVFAIRLRALLAGSHDARWTPARVWRLVSQQSWLAPVKLIAIPLSLLIVFPLAPAIAFYRYAVAVEGPLARARKLASLDQSQQWALLLLLQFLWLIVVINVALALALLPHLLRILTGYESWFTRSGVFFIMNPLFLMLALTATWLVFDPFIQAVYTVHSFHLESLETGEDLRAAMRRIRGARVAAGVAVILIAVSCGQIAHAAIPRERLEESIQEAVKSSAYDWRLPPAPQEERKPWLVELVDKMFKALSSVFSSIGNAIEEAIRWIVRQVVGGAPVPLGGAVPSRLERSIYVVIAAALLGAAWLFWRWRRTRPQTQKAAAAAPSAAVPLDAEDLSPERLPEEEWLALAEQCLRDQNLRHALRALYLANLAWLGRRQILTLHPGKTNREYEAELGRRRAFPEARDLFAANIAVFERAWYGAREVSGDDLGEFRRRAAQIKQAVAA